MTYELILVEREAGVAVITLNRPEVLNAMNRQLGGELHDAVVQANADDEIGLHCYHRRGRPGVFRWR